MSKPKKIFIVEDELIIKVLKNSFETAGFVVETALDGAEALQKLQKFQPDIILLDILMPTMNGLEFLERIKRDERFKNIPVIIFSNLSDPSNMKKSKELGAVEYIIKTNVKIADLIEKAKEYI